MFKYCSVMVFILYAYSVLDDVLLVSFLMNKIGFINHIRIRHGCPFEIVHIIIQSYLYTDIAVVEL